MGAGQSGREPSPRAIGALGTIVFVISGATLVPIELALLRLLFRKDKAAD